MSIANSSILKDGIVAATGGTAVTLYSLGDTLSNHDVYFDGNDFRTRSSASFAVKAPKVKVDAPNGYTQARSSVVISIPLTLANGLVTTQKIEISLSTDVESVDADKNTLLSYAAQVLTDPDYANFWYAQAIG